VKRKIIPKKAAFSPQNEKKAAKWAEKLGILNNFRLIFFR
jgi:hypothetical protein